MLLRSTLSILLAIVTATVSAQEAVSRTVPIESVRGDPVQGGALSEYYDAVDGTSTSRSRVPKNDSTGNSSSLSGNASRTGSPIDAIGIPPPAPMRELAEQSQNGVIWLCGGIGQREVAYLKKEARKYDVMLTFAARNGAYLADVDVDIFNEKGRALLKTRCEGPIMLVDLPEQGAYRIRAETEHHSISRAVHVEERQGQFRHLMMTWPSSVVDSQGGKPLSGQPGATTGNGG